MQFDDLDTARTLSALPPEQLRPQSDRSAWGAPWRAVQAGVADVVGSTADLLHGYGAAGAIAAEADPVAHAVMGDKAIQEGAAEGRRQFASGTALVSDVGESFRNVSESMRPDPITASTAEKLIFGAVRPMSKLLAGAAAGPIGIWFAAGEEGFTQSEDLRRQGVDVGTRTGLGAFSAAATAAQAFLPMAGSTVPRTLGLYLAGGPGGFVAQQAATRAILEKADYHALAQQYDPLDPVGLAVSALVPLPFALHGAMKPGGVPQVPRETVDAAMTHNLSVQQDALQVRIDQALSEHPAYVRAGANGDPLAGDALLTQRFVDEVNGVPAAERTRPAPPARPAPELPGETEAKPAAAVSELDAVRQRVAAIEEQAPEAKAHMDEVRRLAAEGTDESLGTLDADLLQVAAQCAMSTA